MIDQNLIAENHICITQELFQEAFYAIQNSDYRKTVKRLSLVLVLLCIAIALWLLATGGSLLYLIGEVVFISALLFWLAVILPQTTARSKYKRAYGNAERTPERTIQFFADYLLVTSEISQTTLISYNDIVDVQETRNLVILNCQEKKSVLLKKDGFTVGNTEIIKSAMSL